jgi:hypothetical protein
MRFVTSGKSDFAMHIWEYPVVPEGPETPKLNESVDESNAKLETVEFETTEKTF